MTVVSITSGLGNQLFQYAAGLHWVQNQGGELALDTSWFAWQKHTPKREFLLKHFAIPERKASCFHRGLFLAARLAHRKAPTAIDAILSKGFGVSKITEINVHEPDPRFELGCAKHKIFWLDGYWQTANHFEAVQDTLRNNLVPKFQLSEEFATWKEKVTALGGVAVHVRRGDYAKLGHGMLTPAYYRCAARNFPGQKVWFVFSEDLDWCRANLELPGECFFVKLNSDHQEIEELLLMANCPGNIIANSSYSWWGAALGKPENRIVVAPRYRHGEKDGDVQRHRLPINWVQVEEF